VHYLFIGLGGFVGAILRYWIGGLVQPASPHAAFPLGTLVVNVLGCFAIGIVAGIIEARGAMHPHARVFLTIGLLGGFTTFSAFASETVSGFRDGVPILAIANVLLSVGLGLLAVWAGRAVVAAAVR
jgi:CrcB protein